MASGTNVGTMSQLLKDVSVVIPAYGKCPYLSDIIRALLRQSVLPNQIIVVHSGPGDPSAAIREITSTVLVRHFDERVWAGPARNHGVSLTTTKWVAFLDADVLPHDTWLASLLTAAQQDIKRYVVGAVGYATSGGYWGLCRWMLEFSSVHPYLPSGEVFGGGSCNMIVPTDAFRQVGGFPEGLPASEDVVLCRKLQDLGLRGWFCQSARGDHFNVPGFRHFRFHLLWLGQWGGRSRKTWKLPLDVAARVPAANALLWAARFGLISYRVLRWGRGYRLLWLALIPGLLLGVIILHFGFYLGAKARDGDHELVADQEYQKAERKALTAPAARFDADRQNGSGT